ERRSGVVVAHDPVVGPAVQRVAVGAVLRETDAVTPAMDGNEDRGEGLRLVRPVRGWPLRHVVHVMGRGASCESQRGKDGCCESRNVHRTGPRTGRRNSDDDPTPRPESLEGSAPSGNSTSP